VVRISTVGGRLTFHVVHTLLLLPARGEKAGMRGLTAGLRLAATPLTLVSLDLSPHSGER
jgi:hypothetical protein